MKIIKPCHLKILLKNYKLGEQVLFDHFLEKWRQQFNVDVGVTREFSDINSLPSSPANNQKRHRSESRESCRSSPYSVPSPTSSEFIEKNPNVTLGDILNSNSKGLFLTEYYKNNSKFKEEHRTLLINLIANFFEDHNFHMSLNTSYSLERQIVDRFPSENIEYYRCGKRGKIYTKYCNLKRHSKSMMDSRNKICTEKTEGPSTNIIKKTFGMLISFTRIIILMSEILSRTRKRC